MGEIALFSLLTGSLGLQSIAAGLWLRSEQRRDNALLEDEEEQLTPYDSKETIDPMDEKVVPKYRKNNSDPRLVGWEFKILRSPRDLFQDSTVFRQVLEEEAIAGWILLEKLDDRRLRFKRPIAMREVLRGDLLPIDPYRTTYGQNSPWKRLAIIAASLTLLLLPSYLGFMLIHQLINRPAESPPQVPRSSTAP
jgi:hypothetical protein